ncbi:hypothetical protein [Rhizobium sp. J15]|uniref:hypothetical protein n=1 Tax=Rhizobium sp. J15 TaxID=2035450 RepID=UPI001596A93C|nr:hypothetical protein [Rhizobium sp. J15]
MVPAFSMISWPGQSDTSFEASKSASLENLIQAMAAGGCFDGFRRFIWRERGPSGHLLN